MEERMSVVAEEEKRWMVDGLSPQTVRDGAMLYLVPGIGEGGVWRGHGPVAYVPTTLFDARWQQSVATVGMAGRRCVWLREGTTWLKQPDRLGFDGGSRLNIGGRLQWWLRGLLWWRTMVAGD
ncbi:hypothetical protein L1987_52429 [Smallanthus sonchifolius]|uniref:Uncharacterized protein n=1 Tax=Smallanthus sonchifolius TaxID=185202 RepID=A0ACB9ETI6_9ASTR|nr:hypothetical protein L1987_52429 [Smallanthus sonchifolius]